MSVDNLEHGCSYKCKNTFMVERYLSSWLSYFKWLWKFKIIKKGKVMFQELWEQVSRFIEESEVEKGLQNEEHSKITKYQSWQFKLNRFDLHFKPFKTIFTQHFQTYFSSKFIQLISLIIYTFQSIKPLKPSSHRSWTEHLWEFGIRLKQEGFHF